MNLFNQLHYKIYFLICYLKVVNILLFIKKNSKDDNTHEKVNNLPASSHYRVHNNLNINTIKCTFYASIGQFIKTSYYKYLLAENWKGYFLLGVISLGRIGLPSPKNS